MYCVDKISPLCPKFSYEQQKTPHDSALIKLISLSPKPNLQVA